MLNLWLSVLQAANEVMQWLTAFAVLIYAKTCSGKIHILSYIKLPFVIVWDHKQPIWYAFG